MRSLERRDLAMSAGKYGRLASRYNFLSEAPRFGHSPGEANAVIDEIAGVVRNGWRTAIIDHGGSDDDCDAVRGAFCYEGFEQAEPA